MTRGRLVAPVLAHIFPFRAADTEDPDFLEPRAVAAAGDCAVKLPCQVENDEFDALHLEPNGNVPQTRVHLIFHRRDLDRIGTTPKVRDRLVSLTTLKGQAIESFAHLSELYAVEARPLSFGLSRRNATANLLRITFEGRTSAARRFA